MVKGRPSGTETTISTTTVLKCFVIFEKMVPPAPGKSSSPLTAPTSMNILITKTKKTTAELIKAHFVN